MKMKLRFFLWICVIFTLISPVFLYSEPKEAIKYFRLDTIIKITGEITDIKDEECYTGENFKVLYLKEQNSERQYKVEVSPNWFYELKLKKGKTVEVTGSYFLQGDDHIIMTQTIEYEKKSYRFRDDFGFPLWRGKGKMKGRGGGFGKGRRGGRF